MLARRAPGQRLAGLWEFPGGKIEPGETPEQCLARELREELAVEVEVGSFVASSRHDDGTLSIELLAYDVQLISGELIPHDHDLLVWVAPEEILGYALAEADVPIAEEIIRRSAA